MREKTQAFQTYFQSLSVLGNLNPPNKSVCLIVYYFKTTFH